MKKSDQKSEGEKQSKPFWLFAAVLAWLIPGAGHIYAGRRVRGIIFFFTISATFWCGVAMGGVMTVDRHYHPKWFYAQMITGIHGTVSWYRQNRVYKDLCEELGRDIEDFKPAADERPTALQIEADEQLNEKQIALVPPVEDVARAYSGVAGMMNLLVIFDAAMLCLMGAAAEKRAEAKARGYEGEACSECGNFTLVRNGTCLKCDTCGSTTGCS